MYQMVGLELRWFLVLFSSDPLPDTTLPCHVLVVLPVSPPQVTAVRGAWVVFSFAQRIHGWNRARPDPGSFDSSDLAVSDRTLPS